MKTPQDVEIQGLHRVSRVGIEPTTRRLKDRPEADEEPSNSRELSTPADHACTAACTTPTQLVPELLRIAEVWHRLLPPIRAAVLALVNTAVPADPLDDSLPPEFERRRDVEKR